MPILVAACLLAVGAWLYLLLGHGGYWRTSHRLPPSRPGEQRSGQGGSGAGGRSAGGEPGGVAAGGSQAGRNGGSGAGTGEAAWCVPPWPSVAAVVPARDEVEVLPLTLPTVLRQDYPGAFAVILVDDGSGDGTGALARALGDAAASGADAGSRPRTRPVPPPLRVVAGSPPPEGWAGKVWAMAQGAAAAGECDYLLFTDADIAFAPGALTALVRAADGDWDMVSQMALLRARSRWERWIAPAFVYFFAQLYPFQRASRPGTRTAAAAGGCMLVRRTALARAGGLERVAGARIDDVALARLLKRGPGAARCWLGFTTQVRSVRAYPRLRGLWDMVARSAYVQLRHSPLMLAGTVVGLCWLYLLPPVAAIGGLADRSVGGGPTAAWCAGAGLAGWAIMAFTYLPVLRLYGVSLWRAPALPFIAALYTAMTVDSARRHHAGHGGEWKGRLAGAPSRAR